MNDSYAAEYVIQALRVIFGMEFPWDDGVDATAMRVVRYLKEYVPQDKIDFNFTTFDAVANQLVIVKDIEFSSICAHHLLPFYGVAHIGYLPNKKMVGLSKIPRLVDHFAHRPCTQEAMTADIAGFLKHELEAFGVAVVVEARHTCMACRGVRKHNGAMITSEMRGVFLTASEARQEFLELIGRDRV
jgi:GTP cyclohydrolase IA